MLLLTISPVEAVHKGVSINDLGQPERLVFKAEDLRYVECFNVTFVNDLAYPPHQPIEGPFLSLAAPEDDLRFYMYCPPGTRQQILGHGIIRPPELEGLEKDIVTALSWIVSLYAQVGAWLVWVGAQAVAPLLSLSSFITHPMVTTGWPFLLGFANLGFIMALLFIAFATMLQIETMGARRMLPRLLLAAILINFSLVIAGVILDLSRLMMAVMIRVMPGTDLNNLGSLGAALLQSSGLLKETFDLSTLAWIGIKVEANGWNVVFQLIQAALLIWLLAAGFFILIAGLFVRYVALILLLIVSPLAYLALAFPNMGQYATKWWQLFLKYVFYGPIALFILLMVAALNGVGQKQGLLDFWSLDTHLNGILSVVITGAMFVAAAMAGSKFGIIGANATMSFANKRGRQLAGGLTKAAYVGLGGRGLIRAGKDVGRDWQKGFATKARAGELGGRFIGKAAKFVAGPRRDKEGKLMPGEKSPLAWVSDRVTPKTKAAQVTAAAPAQIKSIIDKIPAGTPDDVKTELMKVVMGPTKDIGKNIMSNPMLRKLTKSNPDLDKALLNYRTSARAQGNENGLSINLLKGEARSQLGEQDIDILFRSGDIQMQNTLMNDLSIVRKMSPQLKADILAEKGSTDERQAEDLRKRLGRNLQSIDEQERRG